MKKTLSVFLAILFVVSCFAMLPVQSVGAAEAVVVKVYDSEVRNENLKGTYDDLYTAIDMSMYSNTKDGGLNLTNPIIVLESDITITKTVKINGYRADAHYTVDGNGHTINMSGAGYILLVANSGNEATYKNVKIVSSGTYECMSVNGGKVNFVDCDFTHTGTGATVFANTVASGSPIEINVISGSYVSNGGYALHTKNTGGSNTCVANVYGGYFATNDAMFAISCNDYSVNNIYGGTVCNTRDVSLASDKYAYVLDASGNAGTELNVYGGNFIAPNNKFVSSDWTNYTPLIRRNKETAAVNIYGGNFSGGNGYINNVNNWMNYPRSFAAADSISYNDNTSPYTLGASVRFVDGSNGMRFTSKVPAAVVERISAIEGLSGELSYGTIIAPAENIALKAAFTLDGLNKDGLADNKDYMNIPAQNGISVDAQGNVTLNAALVQLRDDNRYREFSAMPYIKATINGQEVYFYGTYVDEKNTKSVCEISKQALADVSDTFDDANGYRHPFDGKYSFYTEAERKILTDYTHKICTFDGNSIEKYAIVYDAGDLYSYHNACRLRELIKDSTGYTLEYYDKSGTRQDYEILVGNFTAISAESFAIKAEGTKIYIAYNQMHGETASYEYLSGLFAKRKIEFTLADNFEKPLSEVLDGGEEMVLGKTSTARLMTHNIHSSYFNGVESEAAWQERMKMMRVLYMEYKPDAIALQEAYTNSDKPGFIDELMEDTGYIKVDGGVSANYTPIYYNSNTLTLLDSGYHCFTGMSSLNNSNSKSVTWAHFMNSKGDEFIFFSTHFYYQTEEEGGDLGRTANAKELYETISAVCGSKYCAAFGGGDMNCNYTSQAYTNLKNNGFEDCRDAATVADTHMGSSGHTPIFSEEYETFLDIPLLSQSREGEIDLMFKYAADDWTVDKHNIVTDDYARYASDHCPCIIDISY